MKRWSIVVPGLLLALAAAALSAHDYVIDFEQPASWADDVCPLADYKVQEWETAGGGRPGRALRIDASKWERPNTHEIRTLMVNHQPDTPVTISFDFRAASHNPGARMIVNYYDGWCTGQSFHWASDDPARPLPKPLFDTSASELGKGWRRVTFTTPPLKHTVLTIALHCKQTQASEDAAEPMYFDYYIDNLKIGVTPLDKLMDPNFDWHGNYGGTTAEFRRSFSAPEADWCDYADQEIASTPQGDIRYTLFQFRDNCKMVLAGTRHNLRHERHDISSWGESTANLTRSGGCGNLSAVSWGVRQTVSYQALGLRPGQGGKLRVTMRMSSLFHEDSACRVQMGVDPRGGIVTRNAVWTPEEQVSIRSDASTWMYPVLEFDRPKGAEAFTVYFRLRDGQPKKARDESYPPEPNEPQSQGSASPCEAFADWVKVEVVK